MRVGEHVGPFQPCRQCLLRIIDRALAEIEIRFQFQSAQNNRGLGNWSSGTVSVFVFEINEGSQEGNGQLVMTGD